MVNNCYGPQRATSYNSKHKTGCLQPCSLHIQMYICMFVNNLSVAKSLPMRVIVSVFTYMYQFNSIANRRSFVPFPTVCWCMQILVVILFIQQDHMMSHLHLTLMWSLWKQVKGNERWRWWCIDFLLLSYYPCITIWWMHLYHFWVNCQNKV